MMMMMIYMGLDLEGETLLSTLPCISRHPSGLCHDDQQQAQGLNLRHLMRVMLEEDVFSHGHDQLMIRSMVAFSQCPRVDEHGKMWCTQ